MWWINLLVASVMTLATNIYAGVIFLNVIFLHILYIKSPKKTIEETSFILWCVIILKGLKASFPWHLYNFLSLSMIIRTCRCVFLLIPRWLIVIQTSVSIFSCVYKLISTKSWNKTEKWNWFCLCLPLFCFWHCLGDAATRTTSPRASLSDPPLLLIRFVGIWYFQLVVFFHFSEEEMFGFWKWEGAFDEDGRKPSV